ncbi:MAG TPA: LOG family protein [Candidatus Kapabacteria bacterium]|jgi:uncharacterized protein (TIGR00730 family)|nr:LOG family protein [Candidatus Kapabacteria bacterium]
MANPEIINEKSPEKKKRKARVQKAYDNTEFIHSPDGRTIRLLAEYLYPEQYFRKHNIKNTIVFYGSARTMSTEKYKSQLALLNNLLSNASGEERTEIEKQIEAHKKLEFTSRIYDEAVALAEMIAKWSAKLPPERRYYVCTGGGPGMMEAANRGAFQANQPSIGLNISLPFEQEPNIFISDELNFEFHYFFMRKFWFAYLAKAMVALPGGFGTLDELFEILTLRQTLKITRPLPIVLYSEEFWKNTVNFNYLLENRMISEKDFDLFIYANSPKEAFDYLVEQLKASWEFYEKGY